MMECFGIAAGVVVVAAGIAGLIILGIRWQRKIEAAMAQAAAELGGTLQPATFMSRHRIDFFVKDRAAIITFKPGSKNSPPATTVAIGVLGQSPGVLKIYPEDFGSSIAKFFGAQDLRIGDSQFDSLYMVKATPESLAHRVFSPERRTEVVAAVRRIGFRSPVIDLSRTQLLVSVAEFLTEAAPVVQLARSAGKLYELILSAPAAPEKVWVEAASVADRAAAIGAQCQVCGTAMAKDVVHCGKCRTPHHRECWEYNDGCSTFGCGSRKSV